VNRLESRDVILIVGVENAFVVCQGILALASRTVDGHRGATVVAGRAIKGVVSHDSEFQQDIRFEFGLRLFIARRYRQNMVHQKRILVTYLMGNVLSLGEDLESSFDAEWIQCHLKKSQECRRTLTT